MATFRVVYDHGSFRQEVFHPASGKRTRLVLYKRDGQGLSYYYWRWSPPSAGVDNDGIRYRLLRDHPDEFFSIFSYPSNARVQNNEPRPLGWLERFSSPWEPELYKRAGHSAVDGKDCVIYAPRGADRNTRAWLHVWKGYILQRTAPDGTVQFRIRNLKILPKIDPRKFELMPGTVVKVPAALKVRLPPNVTRIEYPGYGIIRSGGGTRAR